MNAPRQPTDVSEIREGGGVWGPYVSMRLGSIDVVVYARPKHSKPWLVRARAVRYNQRLGVVAHGVDVLSELTADEIRACQDLARIAFGDI